MTQRNETTRGLNSTGNRVVLAIAAGLVVSFIGRQLDVHGVVDVVLFVLVAALTYFAVTALRRH